MELRERNTSILVILVICSGYLMTSWINRKTSNEQKHNYTASYGQQGATFNIGKYMDSSEVLMKETNMTSGSIVTDEHSNRTNALHKSSNKNTKFGIQACFQRFICEIHAKPPGYIAENRLEESILSTFSSGYMEGPASPIYPFQLAAHFGQLSSGCQPSACQSLYASCPYSSYQFIRIITRLKPLKRRMA